MSKAKSAPRTKPPASRREELMNVAQHLFLKHGVSATTIEQISAGAGVAKGTFYLYFSSKDDVLAGLRDRYSQELLASIKKAVIENAADDWKGKLASWARASVAGYLRSIQLHDLVFLESRPPTQEGLFNNIIIDHLSGLLEGGVGAGAWSIDDHQLTAVFLFSGFHGVVERVCAAKKRVNGNQLAQKVEQLFFRAVGLPADRPAP
jgi:AcrR family transcriptional regulator